MTFEPAKLYRFADAEMDAPSFYKQNGVSSRTLKCNEIFIVLKLYEAKKANHGWFQLLICADSGEIGKIWVDNKILYEELLK